MKQPVSKPASGALRLLGFGVVFGMLICFQPAGVVADQTPAPVSPSATPDAAAASPAAKVKGAKGDPKQPKAPKAPKPLKEIPLPLTIGDPARNAKVPTFGNMGQILQMLMAQKMTRIDNDRVQMEGTKLDLNQADGKSDYHIEIPACIFDTKTHIITSEEPVVIRTAEFELTGEKMRFDTNERSGELIGKVRMVIRNLKQTAGATPQATPKPE